MYRFPQANIDAFIREGHVTVDDILPRDVIDRAADSFDALYANDVKPTGIIEQPVGDGLEALYQHPALEHGAKSLLSAEYVDMVHTASLHTLPNADEWGFQAASEHVDIQFNRDDWLELPRRIIFTYMIFMDDITPDRAPTVIRPSSHMQIAENWGSEPAYQDHPVHLNRLPALDYAEPIPVVGKKGQVTVASTAVIHAGSMNASDRARNMLFVYFTPRGLNLRFNVDREHKRIAWLRGLGERFAPDRRHIVTHAADGLEAGPARE